MFKRIRLLWLAWLLWIIELVLTTSAEPNGIGIIRYTREDLLFLRGDYPLQTRYGCTDLIIRPHKQTKDYQRASSKRNRGRRGGVRQRLKRLSGKQRHPPLPSIMLANVRSLRNKLDELQANTKYQWAYKEANLICITESWLDNTIADSELSLDGFGVPLRLDRDCNISGKKHGGGLCVYIKEAWCRTVKIRESYCSPDIELLSVNLRPRYLPREFGQLNIVTVYIPPSGNVTRAAEVVSACTHRIESDAPDSPVLILGDFNNCRLNKVLPTYQQYITCATRGDKTIDLCYGNVRNAYRAYKKPPLSTADHNAIHLVPAYRTLLQREGVVKKQVKQWSEEAIETLRACYECTDWRTLTDGTSLEEAIDIITDYILFCEDMIVPTKTVKVFSNNKPWITKELKNILNQKKIAFTSGNRTEAKLIQARLNKAIKEAKRDYKEKVERLFQEGKARDAWKGVKTLAGLSNNRPPSYLRPEECVEFAESLNSFYCRFDKHNFTQEREEMTTNLLSKALTNNNIQFYPRDVERVFGRINPNKAPGPDNISGRLLKVCHKQLAEVFCNLFNRSLSEHSIPAIWKSSIICPVPKKSNPTCNNDYRPVALTSLVMKSFERLFLPQLQREVCGLTDPLQFAYKQQRGVDDAVLTLLHHTLTHLEKPKSFVRMVFVDFSSAFNTVQPHLMGHKLLQMNVNPHLILLILSFLTDRHQIVKFNGHYSSNRILSTGAPQGSVISPVLFTLYTDDCRCSDPEMLYIKYSDDTVIIDTTNSNNRVSREIHTFAGWCENNYLDLNTSKTKEMLVDFRRDQPPAPTLEVNGQIIERVEEYKYLGTTIDHKLTFKTNGELIFSKCQQRLFFLRKMRKLQVQPSVLQAFYKSFVESILTFNITVWFGVMSAINLNPLNRIVKISNKIIGREQESLSSIHKKWTVKKASQIAEDTTHTLHTYYNLMPSGRRYRALPFRTRRATSSFVPTSIRLLNS